MCASLSPLSLVSFIIRSPSFPLLHTVSFFSLYLSTHTHTYKWEERPINPASTCSVTADCCPARPPARLPAVTEAPKPGSRGNYLLNEACGRAFRRAGHLAARWEVFRVQPSSLSIRLFLSFFIFFLSLSRFLTFSPSDDKKVAYPNMFCPFRSESRLFTRDREWPKPLLIPSFFSLCSWQYFRPPRAAFLEQKIRLWVCFLPFLA